MWPGDALPQRGATNWKVFYASGDSWQAYMKPPGVSMIYIFMLAAGAGGSRVADGNSGVGGGGGGSGGMSRLLIPAALLPDIIYVRPGKGGAGATTPNTPGLAGATSYVSIAPNTLTSNSIINQSGASGPASVTAGGTGGGAGITANSAFSSLGLFFTVAGHAGSQGALAANGNGTNVTPFVNGVITTGGAGGSNGTGTPGGITGVAGLMPALTTDTSVSTGAREGFQKGAIIAPGLKSFPLLFSGGTGGFGRNAGNSWDGGDAASGGGGGGGGGSTNTGSLSGDGGNGGDGLIIIGTL